MMITRTRYFIASLALVAGCSLLSSCNDGQSYADLLEDERIACNAYLADHRLYLDIPADTIFEVGENAPYYRLDPEGNIYMQVLDAGDPDDKAEYDDLIYFRFMRMSITTWYNNDGRESWDGNADNMASAATSFRFGNYSLSSTAQYGSGIQYPLHFLGVGCHVNLLVKSQFGFSEEIAYVTPFLYNIRYFRPQT